ncbi:hypothetical protein P3T73_18265 [Kiritimatiellota bacterium B12222]|nr:hypothetical protein P3T73_18265 [Kiritimatiellota bacterium B12222]
MKKINARILGTLVLGLGLTRVFAQPTFINDPSGLTTAINTNGVTFEEEIGNITFSDFNALEERTAFTFDSDDGYVGTGRFDRIELLETEGSPLNLRLDLSGTSGYRVLSTFQATGGSDSLAVGSSGGSVIMNFIDPYATSSAQPVTGIAFSANRIVGGDVTVSLYSDLARTTLIGSSFTLSDNTTDGTGYGFFGFYDGTASIASIVIDGTAATSQFGLDDLNITTIPEPSSFLLLIGGALVVVTATRLRFRK